MICDGGAAATIAVIVYVALLPPGNATSVSLIAPLPLVAQVAPPVPAQVQVWLAMPAAMASATTIPFAAAVPALFTVTV